ncbi:MAG: hypothetical protein Ct9H300mP29_4780 [Candidatus Neomarinimicrobiota bacterium]|nr:MAG: hypothetical protein Ct9H300mP29_4780 [Candidatus Neomarinimicrobiota bacterium]
MVFILFPNYMGINVNALQLYNDIFVYYYDIQSDGFNGEIIFKPI